MRLSAMCGAAPNIVHRVWKVSRSSWWLFPVRARASWLVDFITLTLRAFDHPVCALIIKTDLDVD